LVHVISFAKQVCLQNTPAQIQIVSNFYLQAKLIVCNTLSLAFAIHRRQ